MYIAITMQSARTLSFESAPVVLQGGRSKSLRSIQQGFPCELRKCKRLAD